MGKKKSDRDRHLPFKQVRVALELYRKLQEIAERNDRPVSREIKRALEAHVRANEPPPEE
jgi:predicted transcriptional regulator